MMHKLIPGWLGDVRRCTTLIVALALLKGILFAGLVGLKVTKPFIGTNAEEIIFPIAGRLVNQHRFNGDDSRQDSKMPPAYPFLMAVLEGAKVPHIADVVVLLQMLADGVTALCLLRLGDLLGSTIAGGLAGLAWSLYPPAIAVSTWITQEPLFTTALIASLVLFLTALQSGRRVLRLSFAAGALMGLATLLRATPLLLPVALAPAWIWKRQFAGAAAFLAAMALFIVPWTIRNNVVLHDPIVVATGTGSVFLLGSDDAQVYTTARKAGFFADAIAEGRTHGIFKPYPEYESAIDHWLFRLGLMRYRERLQTRPLSFVRLLAVKSLRLWYVTETAHPRAEWLLALCSLPVVPLGLWQVWCWRRGHMAHFLVCGGVLAYFIAMHVVLLPLERYVLPVYPLLLLGASYWLCGRFFHFSARGVEPAVSTAAR